MTTKQTPPPPTDEEVVATLSDYSTAAARYGACDALLNFAKEGLPRIQLEADLDGLLENVESLAATLLRAALGREPLRAEIACVTEFLSGTPDDDGLDA